MAALSLLALPLISTSGQKRLGQMFSSNSGQENVEWCWLGEINDDLPETLRIRASPASVKQADPGSISQNPNMGTIHEAPDSFRFVL